MAIKFLSKEFHQALRLAEFVWSLTYKGKTTPPPRRPIHLYPLPGSRFYFPYRLLFASFFPRTPIVSTVKSEWSNLKEAPVPSHSVWVGRRWWVGGTEQVLGSLP